jgi:hypothetical protein
MPQNATFNARSVDTPLGHGILVFTFVTIRLAARKGTRRKRFPHGFAENRMADT